jgi:hypothetical protein
MPSIIILKGVRWNEFFKQDYLPNGVVEVIPGERERESERERERERLSSDLFLE